MGSDSVSASGDSSKSGKGKNKGGKLRKWAGPCMAAALAALQPLRARATTYQWIGGTSGTWGVASTNVWSPTGLPNGLDTVNATNTLGAVQTITYNYNGTAVALNTLTLDADGGGGTGSETLTMAADNLTSAILYIANSGSSTNGQAFFNQSGGVNTVSLVGYIGANATDKGIYSLSGGTLALAGSAELFVGDGGAGTVNQSGGATTLGASSLLVVGDLATSTGTYVVSGTGSITGAGTEDVGLLGAGTFNQTGGTNSTTLNVNVGVDSGGTGTYILSGGALNAANFYVGGSSSGTGGRGNLNVTGGVLTVNSTGTLTVYNTNGSGLTLSGGTINTGAINLSGNPNLLNWTSGTLNLTNANFTAVVDSSSGNLASTLNLGTNQSLSVAGNEQDGASGVGVINQSGGVNAVTGAISLAAGGGGTGTYILTGGTVSANGQYIGVGGPGLFNQSGGSNAGTGGGNFISIGPNSGTTGTYILSGGSLAVDEEALGAFGTGTFIQSGGTHTIVGSSGFLALGFNGGSSGTYLLSGGSVTAATEYVGDSGLGNFNQSGGTNTVATTMYIANNTGTTGTYALSGSGTLTAPTTFVGFNGSGLFNQSGGVNGAGASDEISIGAQPGSTGTYVLSGTGLVSLGTEFVGAFGSGTINQSGGVNSINGDLFTAANGDSTGTYILTGGSLQLSGGFESIGNEGIAVFNQSGGSNVIGGTLYTSYYGGSTSTYNLSNTGSLAVNGGEVLGSSGVALFNQSGGTNTVEGGNSLTIGAAAGGTSTYILSGGSATVGGNVYVSSTGALGVLTVSGNAVMNIGGTLDVTNSAGSVVNLSGGTINTTYLNFGGVPTLLNWTSGVLNLTSNVTFDSNAGFTTTSDAFLGSLTVGNNQTFEVSGNETLGGTGGFSLTLNNGANHFVTGTLTVNPTGTITQNAGANLYAADFVLAGGNVNGTLTNQGQFTYQSGEFNGRLANENFGTVSFGSIFTAANGVANYGTITLGVGQTLVDNGAGLDNVGNLNLNGATLSGSGIVTNDYTGTLSGNGTINSQVINNGTIDLNGVLFLNSATTITNNGTIEGTGAIYGNFANPGIVNVSTAGAMSINSAWPNTGQVNLLGTGAALGGGTMTNSGTISGAGVINAAVIDSGTIRADGGELSLEGSGDTTTATAQIQAATGDEVLFVAGLGANSGEIALTGGTFDNNNHAINNTGYISGWGTFRSGGLTNNGFLYIGGNFSAFGPVTNGATGAINATGTGLNAFFGPVTNNSGGSFVVQSGASVTFFNSYTGNAPVGNGGTVTFAGSSTSGPITGLGQTVVGAGATTELQLVPSGGTSAQGSLLINNDSTVDVTNNTFLVNYGKNADPIGSIESYLSSGFTGGAWNGTGINSSSVAGLNKSSSLKYAVGYIDGATPPVNFSSGVASGTIEIMPTLAGDATLSGTVDFYDFQVVLSNFGKANQSWDEGDFDYSGTVDFYDFQVVLSNFGQNSSALTSTELATLNNFAAEFGEQVNSNLSLVSVPEPMSMSLLALSGLGLLGRRRRRS